MPFWSFRTETDRISSILLITLFLIVAAVVLYAENRLAGFLAVLAASGVGAFLGLLFAIPKRSIVPPDQTAAATDRAPLAANTSLEEVSDWLTKTIVGVGLVTWTTMLDRLDRAGASVGTAVFGPGDVALPGGVAILVASSLHGGMCAYLWFSRHLPGEFIDAFKATKAAQGLAQQPTDVAPRGPAPAAPAAVEALAENAQQAGAGDETLHSKLQFAVATKFAQLRTAPLDVDDWARGLFGGKSEVSNAFGKRELTAKVSGVKSDFRVTLTVRADPRPETPAVFFLHNTFPNTTPSVGFDEQGTATLTLSAWGAFTVGVLTDDGSTELELNLATLKGAPARFRQD